MPATSMLRPRTRRLISVEDDPYQYSESERASPYPSRGTSPARTAVPSPPISPFLRAASAQASKAGRDTTKTLSGLWGNSWTAIQGLATNVLGNEAPKDTSTATRRRKPLLATHRRTSSSAPPKQWGPSSSAGTHVGAGTQEERESMVRAMKRKDLLTANEHLVPDSVGRIKRRSSDERLSSSAPPGDNEDRDALVYVHKVRPQDTLAGISIKYNTEGAILRKANRMWPNDSVQTKTTLVIPVDACGVKGRRVAGPDAQQEEDLLGGDWGNGTLKSPTDSLPDGWTAPIPKENDTSSTLSSHSTASAETPWTHDSWVLLPNDKEPTKIGRMPRRALGFFPPARRKSLAFSDASTPRASVDLARSSTSTSSHANSPTQTTQSTTTRPRTSSNLSSISAAAHSRHRSTSGFQLHGPGGVGTMGKNVRSPGPAQDGLNKLFAQHLPSVEPPPDQEYFTPWAPGLLAADNAMTSQYGGTSGARTPLGGPDLSLQEIGGAIEGWVRKVGGQASKLLTEPSTPGQGRRSAVPVLGAVGGDLGDLIELRDNAFEIGDGEEERGRARGGEANSSLRVDASVHEQYQSARPDFHLVLRGRGARGDGGSSKKD
jgi:LysM repeat protein